ncbi:MAG: hypothetical protein JSS27_04740 [Planctomycetes bacterium]|nr:hypothetical protein [Planctomycetota bacterium]
MNRRGPISLLVGAMCLVATSAAAQVPPASGILQLNFAPNNPARKVVLTDQGLVVQLNVTMVLFDRDKLEITAPLEEPVRMTIEQTSPKSAVKVRNVTVENKQGRAECYVDLPAHMSVDDVQNRAIREVEKLFGPATEAAQKVAKERKRPEMSRFILDHEGTPVGDDNAIYRQFVLVHAGSNSMNKLRARIDQLSLKRGYGGKDRKKEKDDREKQGAGKLVQTLLALQAMEVAETYLETCGVIVDSTGSNYAEELIRALRGVAQLRDNNDKTKGEELKPQERGMLAQKLEARLQCRILPQTDTTDANAEWFLGQRVPCGARGVGSIKVSGRLDPASQDRADWWLLEDFDEARMSIEIPKSETFRFDPPYPDERFRALRVISTSNEPAKYEFEIRITTRAANPRKLEFSETEEQRETKFPF